MLLLPDPLGPKTALKSSPKSNSDLLPKLLKPSTIRRVTLVIRGMWVGSRGCAGTIDDIGAIEEIDAVEEMGKIGTTGDIGSVDFSGAAGSIGAVGVIGAVGTIGDITAVIGAVNTTGGEGGSETEGISVAELA